MGLKKGLQGSGKQVTDVVDVQKNRIGEDEQQVHGGEALAFADAGGGQMALDKQLGKQIIHPEVQFAGKLFQGCFDLALKESDLYAMQEVESFLLVLIINSISYLTRDWKPPPLLLLTI